jgi:ribose 5-phosphate isomerase A
VELLAYGLESTLNRLGEVRLRNVPPSPDGGVIADYYGGFSDPLQLAATLEMTPGLVDHGIFPPTMVTTILVGRGSSTERIDRVSG